MQDNKNISNNKYKNILANSFICWRSSIVAPEKNKEYLVIIPNRNLNNTLTYELTIMNYYTKENSDNGEAFWQTHGNLSTPILWADIDAQNVIEGVINNYALELIEQDKTIQEKVLKIINKSQEAEKIIDKTLNKSLKTESLKTEKITVGRHGAAGLAGGVVYLHLYPDGNKGRAGV